MIKPHIYLMAEQKFDLIFKLISIDLIAISVFNSPVRW
jgi:hypothetical protein